MEEFEGADWVLISDETPIDENRRDELLEAFQVHYHAGGTNSIDEATTRRRTTSSRRTTRRSGGSSAPGQAK